MKPLWVAISAVALSIASARLALADEALAKASGCLECHSVDKKGVGPSIQAIAATYKQFPNARDLLIERVKYGGKGNWTDVTGGVPMPPYSGRLSDAQIESLVDWMLGR